MNIHVIKHPLLFIMSVLLVFVMYLAPLSNAVGSEGATNTDDNLVIATTFGRPYHHLKRDRQERDEQETSNTVVLKKMSGPNGRPYHHLIKTRVVERTEFAAYEKASQAKKRIRWNWSEGGKPRHLH